jgi:ring-1,2-phenylacetyl-CoA epoxidase subunit PaaD
VSEPAVVCPFCGSSDVEAVGAWGGQLITRQVRCRGCNTYFEVVRDAFDRVGGRSWAPDLDHWALPDSRR